MNLRSLAVTAAVVAAVAAVPIAAHHNTDNWANVTVTPGTPVTAPEQAALAYVKQVVNLRAPLPRPVVIGYALATKTIQGTTTQATTQDGATISITVAADTWPVMVGNTVHEIGHALAILVYGSGQADVPALQPLQNVIRQTPEYSDWISQLTSKDGAFWAYASSPAETFARAFEQYVMIQVDTVDENTYLAGGNGNDQWTPKSFAPIAGQMEKLTW